MSDERNDNCICYSEHASQSGSLLRCYMYLVLEILREEGCSPVISDVAAVGEGSLTLDRRGRSREISAGGLT
jgi:hypothetical protein